MASVRGARIRIGLAANWPQFALLVAVNAFVGAMVGMERSILPVLAEVEFGVASKTAVVSFIAAFGLSKALTNLFAGYLSERFTRRSVLIAGWLFGLPVPFVLIWAPLGDLAANIETLPRDRPIVTYCGHGERAASAVSVLERAGFESLLNLNGGFDVWREAGYPVS